VKAFKGLTEKVRKGEGGFTLIELLIVIIILGILAAVVAFNVAGFLGAGTEESAKTERAAVQTAIIAGMADVSCGQLDSSGSITPDDSTKTLTCAASNATTFDLAKYMHLPTHGSWTWDVSGVVTNGTYSGGGKICTYDSGADPQWNCTAG
jgi:prepilin-type N-terminal cleavage/methylation domain-containing protein